ncbi:hypothetical protein GALL_147780 [mine drainage metagenome]|uniref:Uncharacterized protein n=1 Tax=mine drainage metagenome TaxID=410659 RepID=A0A1J5S585_9ZZZZ
MLGFMQMTRPRPSVTVFRGNEKPGVRLVGSGRVAIYVFTILSLSNCLETLSGWFHGQDDRDWWPSGLLLYSLLAFAYAVAFSAATQIARRADIRFTVIYNVVLALLLFLHWYLYYMIEIDWLGVNSNAASLTSLHGIIRNDFTSISIYSIFLFGAVVAGRMRRILHGH